MATKKRLIDVNRVINEMQKCIDESPHERGSVAHFVFGTIIESLKKEPTVDAVEVVRCKDCKWWKDCHCTNINGAMGVVENPNWFCASGKRMAND